MWSFSKLFSNKEKLENLKNNVIQNRISHAQLFYGHEGSEVLPAAFAYIKYIFCENKNESDACGQCIYCKQVETLSHPDFRMILPFPSIKDKIESSKDVLSDFRIEFKKNPYMDLMQFGQKLAQEKKSFAIPKRECSELIHFLNLKSYYGGRKVVLIWYPELINTEGMNTILKTLEEPNGSTLILLVSYDIHSILPTVLSRCQKTFFNKPNTQEAKAALENHLNTEYSGDFEALSILTDSHMGLMAEMLMNKNPVGEYEHYFEAFRQYIFGIKNNYLEILEFIEQLNNKGRETTKYFLLFFLNKISTKLRSRSAVNYHIFQVFSEIIERSIFLVERNVSIKMTLLSMIIKMSKVYRYHNKSNRIHEIIEI